jgi:hypothetical protein
MAERFRTTKIGEFGEQGFERANKSRLEFHIPPAEEDGAGNGGEVVFVAGVLV